MASSETTHSPRMNLLQFGTLIATFFILSLLGGILAAGLVLPIASGASTATNQVNKILGDLPTDFEQTRMSEASYIYANDGKTLLATYFVQNREVVGIDQISPHLQNAIVALEDRRFYHHSGVDAKGLMRAFVNNKINGGTDTQGASTLTQQYVKNVLINNAELVGDLEGIQAAQETSYARKVREAKLAVEVEKQLSKDEILENYLNIAQFGSSVYGVETAAKYYFGKHSSEVTIAEAATIAGITQRPNDLDPTKNPSGAENKRNLVLKAMLTEKYITEAEYEEAKNTPLASTLNIHPIELGCQGAGGAAFFCDYVTKIIATDPVFGETAEDRSQLLYRGGLRITTTIDLEKQAIADEELHAAIPQGTQKGIFGALISVEPGTGKILAMSQTRDYSTDKEAGTNYTMINYNVNEQLGGSKGFQAGSTFKTFVLAQWLRDGYTLNENVSANSRTWKMSDFQASCISRLSGPTWSPKNVDGAGSGNRTVLVATARSINTAYVSMLSQLDLCDVRQTAADAGYKPASLADEGKIKILPSMVLGVQETSPLDMANAYATFASGGTYCDPIAILSVTEGGKELDIPTANCRQSIDTPTVNGVNYALQRVVTTGGAAAKSGLTAHTAAGKTGTTNGNTDAWFIGYTPALSTAIWMGNPDDRRISMQRINIAGTYYPYVYGSSVAAPTWKRYMDRALAGTPDIGFAPASPAQIGIVKAAPKKTTSPSPAATGGTGADSNNTETGSTGGNGDNSEGGQEPAGNGQ